MKKLLLKNEYIDEENKVHKKGIIAVVYQK